MAGLSSTQVAAIETQDLCALSTSATARLATDLIHALTTDQVAALTTAQVAALSSAQFGAPDHLRHRRAQFPPMSPMLEFFSSPRAQQRSSGRAGDWRLARPVDHRLEGPGHRTRRPD